MLLSHHCQNCFIEVVARLRLGGMVVEGNLDLVGQDVSHDNFIFFSMKISVYNLIYILSFKITRTIIKNVLGTKIIILNHKLFYFSHIMTETKVLYWLWHYSIGGAPGLQLESTG